MNLWEFKLKVESPYITPWQSDIIFGHLAWAYRDLFGEEALEVWLNAFKQTPSFVLSNAFQSGTFPRPLIPAPRKNIHTKAEMVDEIKAGKRNKGIKAITNEDFLSFIHGESISFNKTGGIEHKSIRTHNVIDRVTGRSLEKNGLYELEQTFIMEEGNKSESSYLSLFVRFQDEEAKQLFQKLLHLVSLQGYGSKKSVGFGKFSVQEIVQREDLDAEATTADGVVMLSHLVPETTDPVDGWYKLETKYGKLATQLNEKGTVFKKPLTRLTPGSIFRAENPKPYYGRIVNNISPFNDQVVQYGYGLAIPIKLPNYL